MSGGVSYAFIVQEAVVLNSEPRETVETSPLLCKRRRVWSNSSQYATGRFVFYGIPREIRLSSIHGSGCRETPRLFINDREMDNGIWRAGDTSDLPSKWRVADLGRFGQHGYSLEVVMEDGAPFAQGIFTYGVMEQVLLTLRGEDGVELCSHTLFRLHPGGVTLISGLGLLDPGDQFIPLQIAGSPPVHSGSAVRVTLLGYERQTRKKIVASPPPPFPAIHPLGYHSVQVSGELRRIYSYAEQVHLKKVNVPQEEYSIVLKN